MKHEARDSAKYIDDALSPIRQMSLDIASEFTASTDRDAKLTVYDLLRIEIDGKAAAVARYDAIIWKIRTGYVVVMYGAVTLLSALNGKSKIPSRTEWVLPLLVAAFSLAAFVIDHTFSRSKFRVVAARNELIAACWHALQSDSALETLRQQDTRLVKLLEMSGERHDPSNAHVVRQYLRCPEMVLVFLALYVVPVLVACAAIAAIQ